VAGLLDELIRKIQTSPPKESDGQKKTRGGERQNAKGAKGSFGKKNSGEVSEISQTWPNSREPHQKIFKPILGEFGFLAFSHPSSSSSSSELPIFL
jgi:hypothetical protein